MLMLRYIATYVIFRCPVTYWHQPKLAVLLYTYLVDFPLKEICHSLNFFYSLNAPPPSQSQMYVI